MAKKAGADTATKPRRVCTHPDRARRRADALKRQEARAARSTATQIRRLQARNKQHGGAAAKELARLRAQIKEAAAHRKTAEIMEGIDLNWSE